MSNMLTIVSRRDLLAGLSGLAAAAALPGAALADTERSFGTFEIALPKDAHGRSQSTVIAGPGRAGHVALSFDDGPHPSLTPQLLDILRAQGMRATFYLIGSRVARWPGLARRILAEGHEIGNHTWSHPALTGLGTAGMLAEIDRTNRIIREATGIAPLTLRPPYGAMSARQRALLYAERRMPTVLWSVDPQDWRRPGSAVVASRIVQAARPGAIVLAHDIHAPTVQAMPVALAGLRGKGLRGVSVSELMGWADSPAPPHQPLRVARAAEPGRAPPQVQVTAPELQGVAGRRFSHVDALHLYPR